MSSFRQILGKFLYAEATESFFDRRYLWKILIRTRLLTGNFPDLESNKKTSIGVNNKYGIEGQVMDPRPLVFLFDTPKRVATLGVGGIFFVFHSLLALCMHTHGSSLRSISTEPKE